MEGGSEPRDVRVPPECASFLVADGEVVSEGCAWLDGTLCEVGRPILPVLQQLPQTVPASVKSGQQSLNIKSMKINPPIKLNLDIYNNLATCEKVETVLDNWSRDR